MDSNDLALLEKLGPEGVRLEMAKGDGKLGRPGSQVREEIEHWLKLKEAERALASSAKHDAREEESLSISRKALEVSQSASRRALIAIALSTTMAIYEIIKWYSK